MKKSELFDLLNDKVDPGRLVDIIVDTRPIVVSFSGGQSSAMMCHILETHPAYRHRTKHYVFANTGREMGETLSFVRHWERFLGKPIALIEAVVHHGERTACTHRLVTHHTLSREGQPFRDVVSKYGLPSISFLHCTRELKANPIRSYIRTELSLMPGEYVQAIGMRFDEPRRVRKQPEFIYPLYECGIAKTDVATYFAHPYRSNFGLGLEHYEGNCDFCFKKSWNSLVKMKERHPSRLGFWLQLEEDFWEENSESYRGHKMAADLYNEVPHEERSFDCFCGAEEFAL